jgi:hypothetical protein
MKNTKASQKMKEGCEFSCGVDIPWYPHRVLPSFVRKRKRKRERRKRKRKRKKKEKREREKRKRKRKEGFTVEGLRLRV